MKKIVGLISGKMIFAAWPFVNVVPMVLYHRVLPKIDESILDDNIVTDVTNFEKNIIYLKRCFNLISLEDVVNKKKITSNSCVITFDDGWVDNYKYALPILIKHNVPAAIFLTTSMINTNQNFWFNRLEDIVNNLFSNVDAQSIRKKIEKIRDISNININLEETNINNIYFRILDDLKKLPLAEIDRILIDIEECFEIPPPDKRYVLNWDEINEMGRNNIIFGSHCVTHDILTNLKPQEKYLELYKSREALLENNINFVDIISFPNGGFDQETIDLAKKAGYRLMLSASIKTKHNGDCKYIANRININRKMSENINLLMFTMLVAKVKKLFYRCNA